MQFLNEKQLRRQIENLVSILDGFDVRLDGGQAQRLCEYVELLLKWNQRTQLISRNDEHRIVEAHLAESLALSCVFDFHRIESLLDFGSGAGLPGVPLAIAFPRVDISLLEAKRKKALFLKHTSALLGLENVHVLAVHSSSLDADEIRKYPAVVARAVADLPALWQMVHPFLMPGGILIAMKGGDLTAQIEKLHALFPLCEVNIKSYPAKLVHPEKRRKVVLISTGAIASTR